jgi:hypothetical protein
MKVADLGVAVWRCPAYARSPTSALLLGVAESRMGRYTCAPELAIFAIHHKIVRIFTSSKGKSVARHGQMMGEWPGWISKSITLEYFYSENIFVPHIIQTNNTIYLVRFSTRRAGKARIRLDI